MFVLISIRLNNCLYYILQYSYFLNYFLNTNYTTNSLKMVRHFLFESVLIVIIFVYYLLTVLYSQLFRTYNDIMCIALDYIKRLNKNKWP